MARQAPGAANFAVGPVLFAALTFGAERSTGIEPHAAIALAAVSGVTFMLFMGVWRLVRGGGRAQRRW
ncbi:hypothetical protein [Acidimangrovimonas sediminis]|uniref:hypothetical protein n=1 Tax=Acidimangrovimonas sediminis TaxID=2056283 RepID=UPI000C80018A|nr:hypothetical protein [Acidimangrovimonas sediminis]